MCRDWELRAFDLLVLSRWLVQNPGELLLFSALLCGREAGEMVITGAARVYTGASMGTLS